MAQKATKKNKFVKAWMAEHVNDPWVKEATRQGYRSRAAFKLIELAEKDRLLRPGMRIVDLGAAPGSWTQVLRERAGPAATIVAIDLLPMAPVAGVTFVQADFREDDGLKALEERARRAPAGPCGFGSLPQSLGRGGGGSGAFGASWRARARICGDVAATRRRSRAQSVPGRGIRGAEACRGSAVREGLRPEAPGVAGQEPRGLYRGKGTEILSRAAGRVRLSPKGDMRLA